MEYDFIDEYKNSWYEQELSKQLYNSLTVWQIGVMELPYDN